jgi:prepilin-type N-terminal cleavage/methylation domain-containing protein
MSKRRGFTLIELMIVVAIIAILASVAVPAFIRYVRRSQTIEPIMNLRKMYDASVAYFVAEHSDAVGNTIAQQFPGSTGWTPAAPPAGTKMAPMPALWTTPEWQSLNFSVDDAIRYAYNNVSSGTDSSAKAAMMAEGDLNGNGVFSLFQRECIGVVNGSENGVQGSAGLYVVNELE